MVNITFAIPTNVHTSGLIGIWERIGTQLSEGIMSEEV